ncbi:MAG: hypothetical protein JNK02_14985 [Planctomycetes bacterium]|nr:hypothetical protein [Planctomycetota bacterium]
MRRAPLAGWIALFTLPPLALGARLLLDAHRQAQIERPERVRASGPSEVSLWTGAADGGGGLRVAARIAPLHADPRRQEFDARALRARDPAFDGEPFLVTLELRGAGAARLDPAQAAVLDEHGTALAPARLAPHAGADPVRTLFAPPAPLGAGQRASFVLVGRAPGAGARLVWGPGLELPLVAAREPVTADLPIASVDRRPSAEAGR